MARLDDIAKRNQVSSRARRLTVEQTRWVLIGCGVVIAVIVIVGLVKAFAQKHAEDDVSAADPGGPVRIAEADPCPELNRALAQIESAMAPVLALTDETPRDAYCAGVRPAVKTAASHAGTHAVMHKLVEQITRLERSCETIPVDESRRVLGGRLDDTRKHVASGCAK